MRSLHEVDIVSQPMIRIEGLTKSYGNAQALRGVSFEVPRGQVVGFLGPNGAGKSTTMKILAGFVTPTSGVAQVNGVDVTVDSVVTRRMMGYLPENNPLYEEMMVRDYLDFIADVRGVPREQRQARIRSAVERCGLGSVLGKDIQQLSKGYRQRVGLAQAILHDPDLLILDEPTSGLDPNQIVEIRNLIRDLGREKTVILSTHILSEVQSTCSRVLIISEGKVVADDAPERLTTAEGGTVTVVLASRSGSPLQPEQVHSVLAQVPGVTGVERGEAEGSGTLGFSLRYGAEDIRRALFEAAVRHDFCLLEMKRQHVSLEETFRKLTGGEAAKAGAPPRAA
ncbi:ATP-binding cassette domain-containing protein [Stigmatella sp. ncwal1]|uniref:ATP-binding cassette domain-containing protein n=1 Tax=Stigmatella ashevillensis TaxID=2995309 RepID=A0ABT5DDA0_9BACT|nr:ATP-binding cassette domain-containing protein [Stigmatella ashevillena]MDC0711670.1 ATP-binding cassette domain-containing protein [Stigmatella ashevillena]